jgi:hypothetical protein
VEEEEGKTKMATGAELRWLGSFSCLATTSLTVTREQMRVGALGEAKTATTTIGGEQTDTQLPDVTVAVLKLNLPVPFSPKSS